MEISVLFNETCQHPLSLYFCYFSFLGNVSRASTRRLCTASGNAYTAGLHISSAIWCTVVWVSCFVVYRIEKYYFKHSSICLSVNDPPPTTWNNIESLMTLLSPFVTRYNPYFYAQGAYHAAYNQQGGDRGFAQAMPRGYPADYSTQVDHFSFFLYCVYMTPSSYSRAAIPVPDPPPMHCTTTHSISHVYRRV